MIEFFLYIGSILDLFLTYKYLGLYRERFPKKDWIAIEANPLIRMCVKSKGLGEGMLIAGTIILFVLAAIIHIANSNWQFFLAGVLYMMNVFHLLNFLALKGMQLKETGGKNDGKENRKS